MKQFTIVAVMSLFLFGNGYAQNDCATALPLNLNTTCVDTSDPGGGANAGDPTMDLVDGNVCNSSYSQGEDYIYSFTPSSDGDLKLELFASQNLNGLFITEGCPSTGNCIASGNTITASYLELRSCVLTANITYYIHISRSAFAVGPFCLNAEYTIPNPGTCELALPLQLDDNCMDFDTPAANSGDPTGCNQTASNACITSGFENGVDFIYSYTPTVDGDLVLDLFTDANFIGVFVTEGCPETGNCIVAETTVSATDVNARTCALYAGITYYIHLTRNSATSIGQFCMNAVFNEPNPSICSLAKTLVMDDNCVSFDTPAANSGDPSACDLTDNNVCSAPYSLGDDYIYEFIPSEDGELVLDLLTNTNFVGLLVTEGCPESGNCVVLETTVSGSSASVRTCFVEAGVAYYVHISRNSAQDFGPFCLNAQFKDPHPGTCERARTLAMDMTCFSFDSDGVNAGNTSGCDETDNNVCDVNYSNGPDYIYKLTPNLNTELTLELFAGFNFIGLMVTEGCPDTGVCVANTSTVSGTNPSIVTNLLMGQEYYIHISSNSAAGGEFCLNASTSPMVPTAGEWGILSLLLACLSIGLITLRLAWFAERTART